MKKRDVQLQPMRFFPDSTTSTSTPSTPLVPVNRDSELLDISENLKPKCCTPQHCCNPQCVIKHAVTMGCVGQQSLLYVETAFTVLNTWGLPTSTTGLVFTIILLLLCFAIMSTAQHRAYLELMDKLLQRFIPNDEERASCMDIMKRILASCCGGTCSERTRNIIGVIASLIKVGLQTFACIRFLSRVFLDWIPLPEELGSALVKVLTIVLSILNTGGQLSFFLNRRDEEVMMLQDNIEPMRLAQIQQEVAQFQTHNQELSFNM